MKKILLLLTSLLLSSVMCGCTAGGETPSVSDTGSSEVYELPEDIRCTEILLQGKSAEVTDEINDRLVALLKDTYSKEKLKNETAIESYIEIKYGDSIQITFGNNDSNLISYIDRTQKIHRVVSVSAENREYIKSLISELFPE